MASMKPSPANPTRRRRRRWWPAVLALAAVAAAIVIVIAATQLTAGQPGAARLPQPKTMPAGPLVPGHGVLFGAHVQPTAGYTLAGYESGVTGLERELGRRLAIDNNYVRWADPMPIAMARWDLSQGRIPMISWGGARTDLIAHGVYDSAIRTRALQLRRLRGPVMLRWFWEMDLNGNRANTLSPRSFVAAWRHIHDIFARAGATNVSWVWCPDSPVFGRGTAARYYPGSRYVDWVATDGYNWAPKFPHSIWRSFARIFTGFYKWGVSTGKPLMVAEFGVLEGSPGEKAAWFGEAGRTLRAEFPAIRAVVYFNSDHLNFGQKFNWRVTTSTSSLAAFRALANLPYFSARPSISPP